MAGDKEGPFLSQFRDRTNYHFFTPLTNGDTYFSNKRAAIHELTTEGHVKLKNISFF
jgi:hypothetical protein